MEHVMANRRDFLKHMAGVTAGVLAGGGTLADALEAAQGTAQTRRRVTLGGRRITVVDVHAHTFVPEVWDLVKDTPLAATAKNNLTGPITLGAGTSARLQYMDKEGIDYQAINVNAWGYSAERALARDVVQLQNEKIAQAVAAHPDRFVGMATQDEMEQAIRGADPDAPICRCEYRLSGVARQTLSRGNGRDRQLSKPVESCGAGHPNIPFAIFEDTQDHVA